MSDEFVIPPPAEVADEHSPELIDETSLPATAWKEVANDSRPPETDAPAPAAAAHVSKRERVKEAAKATTAKVKGSLSSLKSKLSRNKSVKDNEADL